MLKSNPQLFISSRIIKAWKCSFQEYNLECGIQPALGPDCSGYAIELRPGILDWETETQFLESHRQLSGAEIETLLSSVEELETSK